MAAKEATYSDWQIPVTTLKDGIVPLFLLLNFVTENNQLRDHKDSCMLIKDCLYKDLCTIALNRQIDANSFGNI